MKPQPCLFLILVMTALVTEGAKQKKKKKDRKSAPQWKPSSMPGLNKRFESAYEEMDLSLDCLAEASPKPSVKWLKDGTELKSGDKVEVKKFDLTLKALTTDMSGNYTCLVSNKHGQIEWTFHIDVQVKIWPLVIEGLNNITQMVGSNVAFRCEVPNDPKATIRWQKVGTNKKADENTLQADFLHDDDDDNHVLTLDNIKKEDEGEYRCLAGNIWGLKYSSAWLIVTEAVTVTEAAESFDVYKWKNKDNSVYNNVIEDDKFDLSDPNESENMNVDNSVYDGYNPDGLDHPDYDLDSYFTTTKQPKNRNNNRRKSGRKKNKKGKNKVLVEDVSTITAITSPRFLSTTEMDDIFRTTPPEIWHFEDDKFNFNGFGDSRYNPVKTPKDDSADSGNTGSSTPPMNLYLEGSISSWTIYTIVGAAGGVILLIGLVGITASFCCKKEDGSIYKSTPV